MLPFFRIIRSLPLSNFFSLFQRASQLLTNKLLGVSLQFFTQVFYKFSTATRCAFLKSGPSICTFSLVSEPETQTTKEHKANNNTKTTRTLARAFHETTNCVTACLGSRLLLDQTVKKSTAWWPFSFHAPPQTMSEIQKRLWGVFLKKSQTEKRSTLNALKEKGCPFRQCKQLTPSSESSFFWTARRPAA